jgi:hypothetical protein
MMIEVSARPDHLDLGSLGKGARVEISAELLLSPRKRLVDRLFESTARNLPVPLYSVVNRFHPGNFRGLPKAVDLSTLRPVLTFPSFVHLERITPRQNLKWFQGDPYFEMDFSVDTSVSGSFAGEVTAVLGQRRASLPMRVKIGEAMNLPRVLVVSPFYSNATDSGTNLHAAVELISSLPARVDYLRSLPISFGSYDVVFLADWQLAALSDTQQSGLEHFLMGRGRVVLLCYSLFPGTVPAANRLATNYGIQIVEKEIKASVCTNVIPDVLTTNVSLVRFQFVSPIQCGPLVKPLIFAPDGTNCIAAVSRPRSGGELVVLAQSLWWHWLDHFATNSDNRILLGNFLRPTRLQ